MRFPIAALFFLVGSFIFFVIVCVVTYTMGQVKDAMTPLADDLSHKAAYLYQLDMIQDAFMLMCILFFIVGLLLIFVLESTSEEPEEYYYGGYRR